MGWTSRRRLQMGGITIILLGMIIGAVATWLASVLPRESTNVLYGFPEDGPGIFASVDALALGATLGALLGAALAGVFTQG